MVLEQFFLLKDEDVQSIPSLIKSILDADLEARILVGGGHVAFTVVAKLDKISTEDKEYFDSVMVFASHSIDRAIKFMGKLRQLNSGKRKVVMFRDFAPYSFIWKEDGPHGLTGGLIYFGSNEDGSGEPQFSVSLSGRTDERWEIHT